MLFLDLVHIYKVLILYYNHTPIVMIQALIEQSLRFIDHLYGNVQNQEEDIFQTITNNNNLLPFILHHLRIKRSDLLQEFYCKWKHHPNLNKEQFIINILMLIQLQYNSKLCKQLLNNILNFQDNNSKYLSLIPKEIFMEVKKYNPLTYQRKQTKIEGRKNRTLVAQGIQCSSRGYAQITLTMATFMQHGLIKQSQEEVWERLMAIVGRHNLSFLKVINIMLAKSIDFMDIKNEEQVLSIVRHIPFENFILFLSNKIYSCPQQGIKDLVYVGTIQYLSTKTNHQLYQNGIYFYNPRYMQLIRLLIHKQIYQLQQFLSHFFFLTAQQIQQIQLQKLLFGELKVSEAFSHNLHNTKGKEESEMKKQQLIVMGQSFHCFKLALMCQFIRRNDFIRFEQLYNSMTPNNTKIDFIIFMPIVGQLCLLLQWVINPFYHKICYGQFFKVKKKIYCGKQNGYFKQHLQLCDEFFIDISKIMHYLQLNIGFYVKTLVKMIRLFRIILHRNYFKIDWSHLIRFKTIINSLTKLYLLPAITLQQQNCSLSFQMHSLLLQFTQEERFQIYYHYFHQIMFANPYLSNIFQSSMQNQFKILNKLNLKNQKINNEQTTALSKFQHNQFLQGSFYLLKRALSSIYQNESQCYSKALSKSTGLAGEGMAFLIYNYLVNSKQHLKDNKQTNNLLTKFIYYLFLDCTQLDMSFFVRMLLKLMCNAFDNNQLQYFHLALRILKFMFDKAFPYLVQYDSMKLRLEFLTYGYHLKLELLDQVEQFQQHKAIRERLICVLSSKILISISESTAISCENTHHSLLYCFLRLIAARINLITKSIDNIFHSGYLIDECMDFMATICRFFAYQMERERQKSHDRSVQASYFTQPELTSLIRGEGKIPMAFACLILRALKKHELYNSKIHQIPPMKKYWEKAHSQPQLMSRFQKFDQVQPGRTNTFLHSDFYFFFWTSDIENICENECKYKEKIEQLRSIISQGDIFNVSTNLLNKIHKQRCIQIFNMLQREREDMRYYYQKFNITVQVITNKNTFEKVNKFNIPPMFAIKEDADFRDFINLLFLHCLLPRMSVGESEAIFCSKLVYKIIKQNKFSSNKSLILIFALIEASISFIPFSTEREVRCISIFTTDFFRLFSCWHKSEQMFQALQIEIGMQKFTDRRYEKLKDYLMNFQQKITNALLMENSDSYVIRNCMLFVERNQHLPLSFNQSERIIKYMNGLHFKEDNKKTQFFIKSLGRVIESRSAKLVKFSKFDFEKEMKKYSIVNEGPNALSSSKPKVKIYHQQQISKGKGKGKD